MSNLNTHTVEDESSVSASSSNYSAQISIISDYLPKNEPVINDKLDSIGYDAGDESGDSWSDYIQGSCSNEDDILSDNSSGGVSLNRDDRESDIKVSKCSLDSNPEAEDSWPEPNATDIWEYDEWEFEGNAPGLWPETFGSQVNWELENAEVSQEKEPAFKTIIVDTSENFGLFLPILSHLREGVPELGCDCEGGKNFGRHGVLTFFSLTVFSMKNTYLLDVWELLKLDVQVFEQENEDGLSLKKVLGSDRYLQLWFDVRGDWDTLYHKFGVTPGRIVDLQLLEFISRKGQKDSIFGLYRVMKDHGRAFMNSEEHIDWLDEKDEGRKYFQSHELKYGVLEDERPISDTTKKYIAGDTDCMFSLYEHLKKNLGIWEKYMQVPKPKKALEPVDGSAGLPQPETRQSIDGSHFNSESQAKGILKPAVLVEPLEEDWMTFLEKQSTLRAQLAMAPDYNADDMETKYSAPAAFLAITQQEYDMAIERRAKEIESSLLI
ncbi:hypothetical protein EYC80_010997 [Monilinia laxa]|uniref:3'-5' exonuclease domain-containing protein n=1 Tax=Monilinia laxa TaxID=61186 RepID=A0A5N6JPT9_MONLA|nr:hypothetical protein EYC80_010997 [Monilinia laxa]